uniref:Uncharacterized protein n=1 Tax=Plectus sambesii TaxID=2011161 RepID=A0A914UUD7_9BILA
MFILSYLVGIAALVQIFFVRYAASIEACPLGTIQDIIHQAANESPNDAPIQMQIVRKIMEDIFGGTWGVLVVEKPSLVSYQVHWTIPDFRHDGQRAFCLHVHNGWQYNVFKVGDEDAQSRITVEQILDKQKQRLKRAKHLPERLTPEEYEKTQAALAKQLATRLRRRK